MKKNYLNIVLLSIIGVLFIIAGICFLQINVNKVNAERVVDINGVRVSTNEKITISFYDGNEKFGLKYSMSISEDDYNGLINNSNVKKIFCGVVIAPKDYTNENDLNEANLFGEDAVYDWATWNGSSWDYEEGEKTQIINLFGKMTVNNGKAIYEASISNIQDKNVAREFVGKGYVGVELKNGIRSYKFGSPRSCVLGILAGQVINDSDTTVYSNEQKAKLQTNIFENSSVITDLSETAFATINVMKGDKTVDVTELGNIAKITDTTGTAVDFSQNENELSFNDTYLGTLSSDEYVYYVYTVKDGAYKLYKIKIAIEKTVLIGNVDDFLAIRNSQNVEYKLTADLDFTDVTLTAPEGGFSGVLDGDGHIISNLNLCESTNAYGLFSTFAGTIKNIGITAKISDGQTGAIATFGGATGVTTVVDNVYVNVSFSGSSNHCGGLFKTLYGNVQVKNSVIDVSSSLTTNSGLLVGFAGDVSLTLTDNYVIKSSSSATLVGGRGESYATFRDKVNATDTPQTPKSYTLSTFYSLKENGSVTVQNSSLLSKVFVETPISTKEEFLALRKTNGSGKVYVLTKDIDLENENISTASTSKFEGVLDGKGYKVSNFKLSGSANGFFVRLLGMVKNLAITGVTFDSIQTGIIAQALSGGAVVDNVYVEADLTGTNASGGVAAFLSSSENGYNPVKITNCLVK